MTSPAPLRLTVAVITTILALLGLARASATPIATSGADMPRLRLSWSARPERIEVCRALSKEEQEEREEHMRERMECEGHFATYTLRVVADGRVLHESVVRGAGLRHDRPLYLLRELEVPPGERHLRIEFVRREKTEGGAAAVAAPVASGADTGLFAGRAQREAIEHARRARAAIPPRLLWDSTVTFRAGRVELITLSAERGALQRAAGVR